MAIERKIYFYRANCGFAPGGEPIPFPVATMADAVNELDFANGERYLVSHADVRTCCWVERGGNNARLRVADVRTGGLPEIDRVGVLTPLHIPDDARLAESVYIRFFPNQIVGAIYNFYGPRLSRLAYYLRVKAGGVLPPVQFDPLLRHDALERIRAMDRITLFQLRIHRAYLEDLKEIDDSLGKAFEATFDAGDGVQAEITLQSSRAADDTLSRRSLKRIATRIARGGADRGVMKFALRGGHLGSRHTDLVDVLSDELLLRRDVDVLEERTRALNPASAFAAIDDAYEEVRPVLEAADAAAAEDDVDA